MKRNRKSIRTLPSYYIAIGTGFCVPISVVFLLFFGLYDFAEPINAFGWSIVIIIFVIMPITLVIGMIYRGMYSLVTIDEKGMRRSLFGVFRKVSISWDELKEMKCYYQVVAQIFCSKDIALKELTFNKAATSSKLIQIPASPKVLAVVRQYTDKEIIGFPEDKLQESIKKYK